MVTRKELPSLHYIDWVGISRTISFSGWIYNKRRTITSIKSFASTETDTEIVPAQFGFNRPDVHAAHGVYEALMSGLRVTSLPLWTGAIIGLRLSFADNSGDETVPLFRVEDGPDGLAVVPVSRCFGAVVVRSADLPLYRRLRHLPLVRGSRMADVLTAIDADFTPPPPLPQPVTILVPVYRGKEFLLPFFDSLFKNTTSFHRIIIVDDGNDDEEILAILDKQVVRSDNVMLVRQVANSGFAKAVTRGFEFWSGEHLVLANTDTELPPYWLERLVWPLVNDPSIASATPSSNCATICSFPDMPGDNPLCFGLDAMTIDAVIRRVRLDKAMVDIPSGVGFCMALSRGALKELGFFDVEAFARGYGEENDWSLRASARGYRNVHVTNLFVYHKHGGSYLPEDKRRLMEASLKIIEERFPDYRKDVQEYIAVDPLVNLRAMLAVSLAARAHSEAGAILVIGDQRSCDGGPWVRRIGEGWSDERPVIWARFSPHTVTWDYVLDWPGGQARLTGDSLGEFGALCELARVNLIVADTLFSNPFPLTLCRTLAELAREISLTIVADDPRLIDGCPGAIDRALIEGGMQGGDAGWKALWRTQIGNLLEHAEVIWCSSAEAEGALRAVHPSVYGRLVMVPADG